MRHERSLWKGKDLSLHQSPERQRWVAPNPSLTLRTLKGALLLWALALAIICVRSMVSSRSHSLYPIFANAARNWMAQSDLYTVGPGPEGGLDCYRYSPLVAAALTPFSLLPDALGGILWRLLNAGALVAALAWWSRTALPQPLNAAQRGSLFLLVLPFAIGSLNNGQANPLVLALVLAAVTGAWQERWNLASVCLAGACLLKIYPIAIGLLLLVLYPRALAGRLILALAAGLVLPFLLQEPAYVANQYGCWVEAVRNDDRSSFAPALGYKDLQLLSRVWLTPLSNRAYQAIEILAGVGMALLCWRRARDLSFRALSAGSGDPRRAVDARRVLLTFLLGLGCCWMTLFGPATESCTYILVGPVLAWSVLEARLNDRPLWLRTLFGVSYGLLLTASMSCWFPGGRALRALGIQPLAALLLLVGLLTNPATNWWKGLELAWRGRNTLPG
jgi:hypothetical protein